MEKTRTLFRTFEDGAVIALFPDIDADPSGHHCLSYMHVGQHGAAGLDYVLEITREATEEEAAPLREELTEIGYNITP